MVKTRQDQVIKGEETATDWEDLPEPEKRKARRLLKSIYGFRPYIEDLLRKVMQK